jgi:hypothetical protein
VKKEEIVVNTVIIIEVAHYLIKRLGGVKGKEKVEIFLQLPMKIIALILSKLKPQSNYYVNILIKV